jgi:hypothetical protein
MLDHDCRHGEVMISAAGAVREYPGLSLIVMGVLFFAASAVVFVNRVRIAAATTALIPIRNEQMLSVLIVVGSALFALASLGLVVLGLIVDGQWDAGD